MMSRKKSSNIFIKSELGITQKDDYLLGIYDLNFDQESQMACPDPIRGRVS